MRKNVLKNMGNSGYSGASLTDRLRIYYDWFKSIKAPKYFGSSACMSSTFLQQCVYTTKEVVPFTGGAAERRSRCPGHPPGSRGLQWLCSLC